MKLPHSNPVAKAATKRFVERLSVEEYLALGDDPEKPSKYKAVKTEVDGIQFDSRAEAAWYAGLRLREQAGEIRNLQRQVEFQLHPGFRYDDGHAVRAIKIVVDATYEERYSYYQDPEWHWRPVISDYKGGGESHATADWKLKWKMLKYIMRGKGVRFEVAS